MDVLTPGAARGRGEAAAGAVEDQHRRHARRRCTAGRSTAGRSGSRSRRRSPITAPTSSSAPAPTWPRSTASACTATWPSRRCRRSSGCSATARRSPRTSTASARSARTSPSPTACGSIDDDMKRLGDHGASVAHNPGSNMRLGNGLGDMQGHARAARERRHRHRRRQLLGQPERVRGHAPGLARLQGPQPRRGALGDDRRGRGGGHRGQRAGAGLRGPARPAGARLPGRHRVPRPRSTRTGSRPTIPPTSSSTPRTAARWRTS